MAPSSQGKRAAILLLAAAVSLVVIPAPVGAAGPGCATPGRDGIATITGVVNTYYPGTATAAAGATTITVGAATGAATPIAAGDLVLVIQMQDAAIDSTNTGAYGDGVAGDPATGSTALNASGLYEYAVATGGVPLAGGSLTIAAPGLINTYTSAAPSVTQGARDFQVVRVPQYAAATLTSGLTAAPFNGSTGGVLAIDVASALTLNAATVSVSQEGFRAGLGRQLTGGAGGTGTDYRNLSANPFHAQKGEGDAGTPQYLFDSRTGLTVNNGADGLPNGSTARGAPGTAGGGSTDPHPTGNDENTGGGGGANGGAGGMGGNSWNSNLAMGGFGGTAFPATAARVTPGAGGGAGTRNNSGAIANASSGGNGGGIVMIRTGSVTGTATITADGGTGVAPDNDGGGGGGAGGSVVLVTRTGALGGFTVDARGGAGTTAWATSGSGTPAGANYHGPGGGGGGGVVLTTSAPATVNVGGGLNGTTTTDLAAYGATPGGTGSTATITAAQIPGAGSGADCSPDLTIAKTHLDPFVRGGTGTYTLTVNNVGGAASSGTVTVTDTLPAGLTPTSASGTGWTCGIAAQTVTCTRADAVAASASYPGITITVGVSQSAAASLTNTATVAGGGELNTANDTATDPTSIVSRADVAVTKIASSPTVTVGSNVTFTVTAQNLGPSDATGVQVTDQLPAGLTFVSAAASTGTYTSGTGVWDIGALANGASATLTLTATVTTTGALTNTARKTAETETDPNAANDSASATVTGQASDLTISKTHAGSFVRGSTGSYSLTVNNVGAVSTSGTVTVTDTLPAGLTPTAAAGTGWTCGIAAQTMTCTRSDALAPGGSYPVVTVSVAVTQAASSPLTNTATVAGGGEVNTANDTATDPTTVTSLADVAVAKVASSGTVTVGSNVTFTVTAQNLGPSNATGVQVTDQLPAGLTFVSAFPSTGTYTSGSGVWNIGALANGASATLTVTATVTTTGSLTNTARKTAENETDPNSANNTASVTITGQAPDLTILKSHLGSFVRGTTGSYSLAVNNIGAAASSGLVTVSDPVPAGLTPTAASGTGWTCGIAAQTVTCTRSDALAASASYPTITVTVAVPQGAPSSVTNTAAVAGGNELNTGNDSSSDPTSVVSQADIAVSKVASSGTVTVGSNVTFTVTAQNLGPSNATGVQVTDQLPAGLTFVSASPSTGTYTSGTGVWDIGALANGTSATLTLTATVTATGTLTNTARKTAETETDPNLANDTASAAVNGQAPDLTIAKSHPGSFVRGATGGYTLTINNVGPVATNAVVTVSDTLPAGLTPTSASGTGWACGIAAQTVTCTRADALAAGAAYPTISITVAVSQSATTPLTNSATVGGGGEVNTANDTATDPTAIVSQADVAMAKVASSGTVTVGSNVNFTVTAQNLGPSDATGVQVTDQLPPGLTFVSASTSAGAYTNATGIWNIGALASGTSVTLTLTATVTSTGAITNTARKTAENETDPNAANNTASVTVTGQAPDLTISKAHVGSFVRGSTGSYSLTVNNVGPVATSGTVTVTDTVPVGLTPTVVTGTGWACGIAAQTVTCTRSDALATSASYPAISVTVAVNQSAPASVTNTTTVAGGNEVNTGNDSSSDPTAIVSQADIAVAKVASSGTATVGSNVTFTVTAQNLGPSNATGVQVTDQLPAGLTFASASTATGTYTSGTGVWDIGPIASGTSATLTLTATVTTSGALTNTARKSAETENDPNLANDSASATVNGQAPDLTIAKSHSGSLIRGATGSYTLTVNNVGPVASSGAVTVTDTLPAGLSPTAASGTGWTCGIAAQTVTCNRSDALAAAASYPALTVNVSVAQSAPGSVTNVATVAGGNELNTSNDSASDPSTISSQADIAVSKIASSGSVSVGQPVSFTVTTTNAGPSDATGVQITDQLPAGLTLISAVPSAGTYNNATSIWNIGGILSGASATLTITATVTAPGAIVNTATKTAETQPDPNTANDTSSATVNGQVPDLTITKTHTDPLVRGAVGTYRLTVSNVGLAPTNGAVTVSDTLPAGLTPSAATGTGWSCAIAAQAVTCIRADALAQGAAYPTISVTVSVSLSATTPLTNSATVAGGGEFNLLNDSSSDPTTITSVADVSVTKTASSATVQVGSNVTYTITAANAGPSNASGVQFSDLLPAGLTFVSATPSTGTYVSSTGVWTVGGLVSGASATLTMTATVSGTGVITNTVSKTAENETDPVPGNNVSSTSITAQPTPTLPGPPSSGMAPLAIHQGPAPQWGLLLLGAGFLAFLLALAIRRRSIHLLVAALALSTGTLMTLAAPTGPTAVSQRIVVARSSQAVASDVELFGKDLSRAKPVIGSAAPVLHAVAGAITPTRIRIPALNIDTVVENVGVTRTGAMDVPANIWEAAWLDTGVRPGATGQSVIDGHLDSVGGSALFNQLHGLAVGDRIYVSDATGGELTFQVTAEQVAPLNGFPTLRVFGPSKTHGLNLITCAGKYDTAHRTYDHRLIVFTTQVA